MRLESVTALVLILLLFWFLVWFWIQLPYRMATARGRDGFGWVVVSLLGSPILAILLLLIAGQKHR